MSALSVCRIHVGWCLAVAKCWWCFLNSFPPFVVSRQSHLYQERRPFTIHQQLMFQFPCKLFFRCGFDVHFNLIIFLQCPQWNATLFDTLLSMICFSPASCIACLHEARVCNQSSLPWYFDELSMHAVFSTECPSGPSRYFTWCCTAQQRRPHQCSQKQDFRTLLASVWKRTQCQEPHDVGALFKFRYSPPSSPYWTLRSQRMRQDLCKDSRPENRCFHAPSLVYETEWHSESSLAVWNMQDWWKRAANVSEKAFYPRYSHAGPGFCGESLWTEWWGQYDSRREQPI